MTARATNSETTRRVPGLYEMNISADELFSHDYVEFYVCAENQYHRNLTETYKVDIHKLSTVDGVRTNITDGEEVGGRVTITANSAALTVSVNGNLEGAEASCRKLEQISADQITAEATQAALPYLTYAASVGT